MNNTKPIDMKITELLYFLELSEDWSLCRTAKRLGIAQPTLSISVRSLESRVGGELLFRGKKGLGAPTLLGLSVLPKIRALKKIIVGLLEVCEHE